MEILEKVVFDLYNFHRAVFHTVFTKIQYFIEESCTGGALMYRILVVDDEAKIRLLLRKYAEFEGHTVTEAADGMEAVELFRKNPTLYDIVIMDVTMPELDGFSAVSEIRKIASPAVIMLSAEKVRFFVERAGIVRVLQDRAVSSGAVGVSSGGSVRIEPDFLEHVSNPFRQGVRASRPLSPESALRALPRCPL